MAIRRARRNGTHRGLIPVRANRRTCYLSCWYCDWKIFSLNELLYFFGQRYARFLRNWMTFGVALSVISLFGITMMLFWEAAAAFHLHRWSFGLQDIPLSLFWGTTPLVSGLSISIMDFAVVVFSTVISVTVHELGHAVAAASEGVPIEYVAIFLAVIFPGALVAFNNDLLQALPNFASLRIYCAGIWHNAVFSLVCGLALLLLPLTLHPLYIHGENAMVLEISPSSPLSDYLSRGDVILSVDGEKIHSPHELMEKMVQVDTKLLQGMGSNEKGYCVPNVLLEESKTVSVLDDNFSCPDGHAAFIGLPCLNSSSFFEISSKHHGRYKKENKHCLSPELVVKLTKCGEGWGGTGFLKNPCSCSKNEYCMKPLLIPGMSWFEVSYAKPYSSECFQLRRNTSLVDFNPGYGSYPCGIGTFVYVGDMLILAHSMRLSAYQPRWMHFSWSMDVPSTLENILACAYHVSAALAAMNSLPVFFLDGEYILGTGLYYITWLNPRKRRRAAKVTLIAGTILSVIALSRIIYFTYYPVTKV
ncbi:hypothetical protein KFK09_026895 [Dendrobium nobile]|uniref:Endopeptidase S2P n=1 Tax=Dendrobium nobile TaxID=94219 RepID=A0A8T3A929_DENNO|nr:hypothetical protein KFK09_026895 [Dendrobium nobile]